MLGAGLLLSLLLLGTGCGRRSGQDPVGPVPGPPAPVFEYVQRMIDDPWFAESLPGGLTDGPALVPIREALETELRFAVESRSLTRLEAALRDLEDGTALYRARPGFDPSDGPSLAAFELFVLQARAIRDGRVSWSPAPILRRDGG
ncbi:MAG TPA: hypothetical protein VJP59_05255 [Gemmatimonadota bacterium]|nr:hypothetical protein [Gemmatimonadota bacterium]